MGAVDDYINSLDGQNDLSLPEVAGKLLELHNAEMGTATAKIESLTASNAEKDSTIAARDGEITQWKARNWDLLNQIPANNPESNPQKNDGDGKPDASQITFDDLM